MDRGDQRPQLIAREVLHLVDGQQQASLLLASGFADGDEQVGEVLGEDPGVRLAGKRVDADRDRSAVGELKTEGLQYL